MEATYRDAADHKNKPYARRCDVTKTHGSSDVISEDGVTSDFEKKRKRKRKRKCAMNHGELKMIAYHQKHSNFINTSTKELVTLGKTYFNNLNHTYTSSLPYLADEIDLASLCSDCEFTCKQPIILHSHSSKYDDIFNRVVTNTNDAAHLFQFSNQFYIIPAQSTFIMSDFKVLPNLLKGSSYDVIVMDPPWENKSVKRSKKYSHLPEYDLKKIPIQHLLSPDGIIVVWVTNKQKYLEFVRDVLFKHWEVELVAHWHLVKLTTCGEYVTEFSSTHKKPYEPLLIGRRKQSVIDIPRERVLCSLPCSIHSRKPTLHEILRPYVRNTASCLELFARSLIPGWTSWGNETIRFQNTKYFFES